ncbi:MAG TPA: DUF1598 domain-containing protein, partial [Pirellulaceae bacterium]|nr:DUF1598 domain-containing protein [Pirellulaceae bacterium]
RLRALAAVDSDLAAASRMRKVSLRRISAAIDERRLLKRPLDDALQNLAGLTRIEFVFAYPEQNDIVLAGPAEGWQVDDQGNVVGRTSGQPVLQLDDLIVALRTAKAAATGRGISCSIDPTADGLKRLKPLLHSRSLNEAVVGRLEQALGPQQITITGVPAGSHFARVLVAADFLMKRLGMNFERAPVDGLPSYLELLAGAPAQRVGSSPQPKSAMPRWWMAPHYEPLLKDADGLTWQLRGRGVQTLTEDGYLGSSGAVVNTGREDPLAKKWADAMTSKYESLAKALPVFAELRNCMDLAVVAALLVKEDLPMKTGCDVSLLLDENRIAVAQYSVPKTVDSQASLVRKGKDWILSLSGGVQVDSWSVLEHVETRAKLGETRRDAQAANADRWWWD